jgi:Chaperone of endosialidase
MMEIFKSLILCIFITSSSLTVNAQIEVMPNGKIKIGNRTTAPVSDDTNNETTIQAYGYGLSGSDAMYRPGARMSFGDYGSKANGSNNVYIGEYGTTDTDKLELGGKGGIVFSTQGAGNYCAATLSNWGTLTISSGLVVNTMSCTSDERLKKNIKKMTGALDIVKKTDGISYDLTPKSINESVLRNIQALNAVTDKEKAHKQKLLQEYNEEVKAKTNQIGFSAQAMQKILPDLVHQSKDDGYLSINYVGYIPVLTEAIKEQQLLIEALRKELDEVKKKVK